MTGTGTVPAPGLPDDDQGLDTVAEQTVDPVGPVTVVPDVGPGAAVDSGADSDVGGPSDLDPTTADAPDPPVPLGDAVDFRMALVSSVSVDLPNQHPSVVLREIDSPRRQLTFSIGMPDAVALSHAVRRIPTPRPLTHELMSGVLQQFDIDLVAVRMVGRTGAVYFAELDLRGRNGRSVLSCRPSDAITLALHQPVPVPILIDARLLEGDGDIAPPGPTD